jgi:superfamily II DNA/RNA helicase
VLLQKLLEARGAAGGGSAAAPGVFALVLVPTRELVEQTATALSELAHYACDVVRVVGLGGGSLAEQAASLARGADVVVGTPAKVLAHLAAGSLNAETLRTSVSVLVVDEADLVLSYGGGADVKVRLLPPCPHA